MNCIICDSSNITCPDGDCDLQFHVCGDCGVLQPMNPGPCGN